MHLLVLSAFRRANGRFIEALESLSQCTFWCSVLSDRSTGESAGSANLSQCTFWCSVLSDLLRRTDRAATATTSQCTFWCSVLSDVTSILDLHAIPIVSMHLLVLSAFRQDGGGKNLSFRWGLNAPSGAQCFPTCYPVGEGFHFFAVSQCTFWCSVLSDYNNLFGKGYLGSGLNAPSGAQCFPTCYPVGEGFHFFAVSQCTFWCSVLSDYNNLFGKGYLGSGLNAPSGAQCFPTCYPVGEGFHFFAVSQCTFWCSVLSDLLSCRRRLSFLRRVSMHLLVLSAFRL